MAEDVVAWCNGGRNLHQPTVIIGDQLIVTPGTRRGCIIDQTNSVNLEKLQCGLINSFATGTTVGQVGDDGAMVSIWPWSPLKTDLVSSCNGSMTSGVW